MKNCKNTKLIFLSKLTIYKNDWPTYILTRLLLLCFIFCEIPKYIQTLNNIQSNWMYQPVWTAIVSKIPTCLLGLLGIAKAVWLNSVWSEVFLCTKLIFFLAVSVNGLSHLPRRAKPFNQLLIHPFLFTLECHLA